MKIFLSYSSKQQALAERIYFALKQPRHSVFFNKKSLKAGGDFRRMIRKELDQSEVFVFLISPASVALNSYARSELEIACEKWPQPGGHILPVMAVATDLVSVPSYLKAVTILEPEGEIVEAVVRSLDDWSPMEEVDIVEDTWRIAEERGISPSGTLIGTSVLAQCIFKENVLNSGTPNTRYRRRIRGIMKGGYIVDEWREYTASAGMEYEDDRGRKCRDVTL